MAKSRQKPKLEDNINAYAMFRDIGITAIEKGYALLLSVLAVIIFCLHKIPKQDIKEVSLSFIDKFSDYGWAISVCLGTGWFFHARWQRRLYRGEMNRLVEERNYWQKKVLGDDNISSSKG